MLQSKARGRIADISAAASAQATAGSGGNAGLALSHHSSTTNSGGPIGPGGAGIPVTWISPPFVSLFGVVLVIGSMGVQESLADTEVAFQIVRDPPGAVGAGGTVVGSTNEGTSGGGAPQAVQGNASFIDTVVAGTSHTWGIQALPSAGTATIPSSGASIILIDLPG